MTEIAELFRRNRTWAAEVRASDPAFFSGLANQQSPEFLWIGCSDSRVAPNLITATQPGDMFVHRNIANLVVQTDVNLLSVLQYAVDVLKVNHVIVCGHYGCGGVKAAMGHQQHGLIDNWLRCIKDTQSYYWKQLEPLDEHRRFDRLVELNVIEQVYNLGKTNIVQDAWRAHRRPYLHGWVFDLGTGHVEAHTPMINSDEVMLEICKFHNRVVGH